MSPLVALSAFGTQASASAVCAAGAATVGAAGAAAVSAAQAPAAGCVLPVVDLPPPVAPVVTPAYLPAAEGGGIGLVPILIGAAVLAGLAAWLLLDGDDDDDDDQMSPD